MRKQLLTLTIFISMGIVSCNSNSVQPIVKQYFDDINKHDVNLIGAHYADNAKITSTSWDGEKLGPQGAKDVFARYFSLSLDLTYKITSAIYSDTTAVVEYESNGSIPVDDPSEPAYMLGKRYKLQNCVILHFKDGLITSQAIYFDQVPFLRQVGYFDQPANKH
jgi:ketosteroid isomerase-like protein